MAIALLGFNGAVLIEIVKLASGRQFGQWTLKGEEPLGAGGNGVVWRAESSSGQTGAIKFLKSNLIGTTREKRFRDEIEFLRREEARPGILNVIDFQLPASLSNTERLWFSTALATPFSAINFSGVSNLSELVRRIEAVAQTLADLHDERKWHRDLKPENLFLLNDETAIGDFGLVDFPDKEAQTTETGVMGPIFYVAPEMMGNAADRSAGPADVYSLAKTLWVLASGRRYPLQGEQRIDTLALRLSTYCPHNRATNLDFLIQRATSYEQSRRPTMREFADELAAWLKPPSVEIMNADFESLRREYRSVFATERASKQNRDELIGTAKEILASFGPQLDHIATRISECTQTNPHVGAAYDLEKERFIEYFGGVRSVWNDAAGVRTTIGEDWAVFLQTFVQVEALDDDTIRLVAGHTAEETAHGQRFIRVEPVWRKEVRAPRGSAQLENGMRNLRIELSNNLGAAIQAFGERVKDLRKHE